MTSLFADTFYYLAVLTPGDAAHEDALVLSRKRRVHMVTTAWVLTEVGDAMAASSQRRPFLAFLAGIKSSPSVTIVPPPADLFDAGIDLFWPPPRQGLVVDRLHFLRGNGAARSQRCVVGRSPFSAGRVQRPVGEGLTCPSGRIGLLAEIGRRGGRNGANAE